MSPSGVSSGCGKFLSTPSARRATASRSRGNTCSPISIHALREEGDAANTPLSTVARNFYPRPPRGGRLGHFGFLLFFFGISIHALREEGDGLGMEFLRILQDISIHALREEGDLNSTGKTFAQLMISIHALREEGDLPSAAARPFHQDFYPRPPRGGRLTYLLLL